MGRSLLSPTMVSNKLAALKFIRRYWAEQGASPSYGEIAAALGTNREQVYQLVKRLAEDGTIIKGKGPRSISLPGTHEEMLRKLRAAGWKIDEGGQRIAPPLTVLTDPPLPLLAELDDIPDQDVGGLYGNHR